MKRRGYTIVELLIVVAILGTIAAVAVGACHEYQSSMGVDRDLVFEHHYEYEPIYNSSRTRVVRYRRYVVTRRNGLQIRRVRRGYVKTVPKGLTMRYRAGHRGYYKATKKWTTSKRVRMYRSRSGGWSKYRPSRSSNGSRYRSSRSGSRYRSRSKSRYRSRRGGSWGRSSYRSSRRSGGKW